MKKLKNIGMVTDLTVDTIDYIACKICKEPIKKCYLTEGRDGGLLLC